MLLLLFFFFLGLLADSYQSYNPAFYMAGAVVLVGACLPFMLLCPKNERKGPTSDHFWDTMHNVNAGAIGDSLWL